MIRTSADTIRAGGHELHLDGGLSMPPLPWLSWAESFSAYSVPVPAQPDRSGVVSGLDTGALAPVWGDSC